MVKVANDILLNMNSNRVTLLVLLDLCAAFDTVDHAILLKRSTTDFGFRREGFRVVLVAFVGTQPACFV